jgi:hypothetical protein
MNEHGRSFEARGGCRIWKNIYKLKKNCFLLHRKDFQLIDPISPILKLFFKSPSFAVFHVRLCTTNHGNRTVKLHLDLLRIFPFDGVLCVPLKVYKPIREFLAGHNVHFAYWEPLPLIGLQRQQVHPNQDRNYLLDAENCKVLFHHVSCGKHSLSKIMSLTICFNRPISSSYVSY